MPVCVFGKAFIKSYYKNTTSLLNDGQRKTEWVSFPVAINAAFSKKIV